MQRWLSLAQVENMHSLGGMSGPRKEKVREKQDKKEDGNGESHIFVEN